MEEGKSRSFVLNAEQIQFPAQFAVVALAASSEKSQMGFQVLAARKGGTIDALQHGSGRVSSPVGPCHSLQLKVLHLSGTVHMGPLAEINKLALAVDRDLLWQFGKEFEFVGLVRAGEELDRLCLA